jgi:hypothetical protein
MTTNIIKRASELTARQWELYTSSFPREIMSNVAAELSAALVEAMKMDTREEADIHMLKVMRKNAEYGASDTEPRWVASYHLDHVFPDDGESA